MENSKDKYKKEKQYIYRATIKLKNGRVLLKITYLNKEKSELGNATAF